MSYTNWTKIKNEYINTNISQRKLAKKYGISVSTLTKRANKEKWQQEKEMQRNKIETEVDKQIGKKIIEAEVDRMTKLLSLSDKISAKIEKAIDQLETSGTVDTYKLRQVVQSLKDIKDITLFNNNGASSESKHDELINAIKEAVDDEV